MGLFEKFKKEKLQTTELINIIENNDAINNSRIIECLNKYYNVNLNYTIESINEIMNVIEFTKKLFNKKQISWNIVDKLLNILGVYVGDTLLKNDFAKNGFKWTLLIEINNEILQSFLIKENMKGPFVACIKGIITPIEKVHKYWNNGKEDDLYSYCKVAIQYFLMVSNKDEEPKKLRMLF